MAKLYVANCTKQTQVLMYRLDFDEDGKRSGKPQPPRRTQPIPKGQQILVGGNLDHPMQVTEIIGQLEKFGLVAEKDIGRLPRRVVPFIYSLEIAVRAKSIQAVLDHNHGIISHDGKLRREAAAIAAASQFDSQTVDTSIEEIEESDRASDAGPRIEEGYRLTHDENQVPPEKRERIKRNSKRASATV